MNGLGIFYLCLGGIAIVAAAIVGFDMLRFHVAQKRAENPDKIGTAAGGVLFIQGGKTYYTLPKGERRKIADYAMDLRPGSPDMAMFKRIMQQAADEHAKEVADTKTKAMANMREVAKEEAGK
jgi:hypothetical protein